MTPEEVVTIMQQRTARTMLKAIPEMLLLQQRTEIKRIRKTKKLKTRTETIT